MTKHSYFPCTSTYGSTRQNTNIKYNIHHTPHTNIFRYSKVKKTLSSRTDNTQKHSHRPPHSHYNKHKTNMGHIHTCVVSRDLATRGDNKILRTPQPHICIFEEILLRFTRRTLALLRTNTSQFLKSYLHKVTITTMPPLLHSHTRHTSSLQLHPHTYHIVTPLE